MATINKNLELAFANCVLRYNGFDFPKEALHVSASVVSEPAKNEQTIRYEIVTLTVDFMLVDQRDVPLNQQDTDYTVNQVRKQIMQVGKVLKIDGYGLGTLEVNGTSASTGGYTELRGGPFPRSFEWEPVQGNRVAHIVWVVDFTIPHCITNVNLQTGSVLEFSYSVGWDWGDLAGGVMTIITSGTFTLFTKRQDNTQVFNSIFSGLLVFLNNKFPRRAGFDRTYNFVIAENHRDVNFTLTDAEKTTDVALPEPILDLDMNQSLKGSLKEGFYTIWTYSITMAVKVYKPKLSSGTISRNKALAYVAVGRILLDRLSRFLNYSYYNQEGNKVNCTLFVNDIEISDEVTGLGFNISVGGTLRATTDIVLAAAGMFDPIGGTTANWLQRDKFLQQQGSDEYTVNPFERQSDVILDLCHPLDLTHNFPKQSAIHRPNTIHSLLGVGQLPEPSVSWEYYDLRAELFDANETIAHAPLSAEGYRTEEARGLAESATETSPIGDYSTDYNTNTSQTLAHNHSARTFYVTMRGSARRIGYRINSPNLLTYGGMQAVKYGTDRILSESTMGGRDKNGKPVVIHSLAWEKTYLLIPKDGIAQPKTDLIVDDVPQYLA